MLPTGYQFKALKTKHSRAFTRSRSFKRKVDHVDIEDDVYDGIKRLYSEDPGGVALSCSSEFGQDGEGSSTGYVTAKQVCAN